MLAYELGCAFAVDKTKADSGSVSQKTLSVLEGRKEEKKRERENISFRVRFVLFLWNTMSKL